MDPINKFHAGLRRLDEDLAVVVSLTDRAEPPPEAELTAARWAVVRRLAEVATFREKFLFAPLETNGDPAMMAQAVAIRESMQAGMQTLIVYANRWSAEAVRDDWRGYRSAQRSAHAVIHDHFRWEAEIVPPMLAALHGETAVPKRNWTRPIWAVKESFGSE